MPMSSPKRSQSESPESKHRRTYVQSGQKQTYNRLNSNEDAIDSPKVSPRRNSKEKKQFKKSVINKEEFSPTSSLTKTSPKTDISGRDNQFGNVDSRYETSTNKQNQQGKDVDQVERVRKDHTFVVSEWRESDDEMTEKVELQRRKAVALAKANARSVLSAWKVHKDHTQLMNIGDEVEMAQRKVENQKSFNDRTHGAMIPDEEPNHPDEDEIRPPNKKRYNRGPKAIEKLAHYKQMREKITKDKEKPRKDSSSSSQSAPLSKHGKVKVTTEIETPRRSTAQREDRNEENVQDSSSPDGHGKPGSIKEAFTPRTMDTSPRLQGLRGVATNSYLQSTNEFTSTSGEESQGLSDSGSFGKRVAKPPKVSSQSPVQIKSILKKVDRHLFTEDKKGKGDSVSPVRSETVSFNKPLPIPVRETLKSRSKVTIKNDESNDVNVSPKRSNSPRRIRRPSESKTSSNDVASHVSAPAILSDIFDDDIQSTNNTRKVNLYNKSSTEEHKENLVESKETVKQAHSPDGTIIDSPNSRKKQTRVVFQKNGIDYSSELNSEQNVRHNIRGKKEPNHASNNEQVLKTDMHERPSIVAGSNKNANSTHATGNYNSNTSYVRLKSRERKETLDVNKELIDISSQQEMYDSSKRVNKEQKFIEKEHKSVPVEQAYITNRVGITGTNGNDGGARGRTEKDIGTTKNYAKKGFQTSKIFASVVSKTNGISGSDSLPPLEKSPPVKHRIVKKEGSTAPDVMAANRAKVKVNVPERSLMQREIINQRHGSDSQIQDRQLPVLPPLKLALVTEDVTGNRQPAQDQSKVTAQRDVTRRHHGLHGNTDVVSTGSNSNEFTSGTQITMNTLKPANQRGGEQRLQKLRKHLSHNVNNRLKHQPVLNMSTSQHNPKSQHSEIKQYSNRSMSKVQDQLGQKQNVNHQQKQHQNIEYDRRHFQPREEQQKIHLHGDENQHQALHQKEDRVMLHKNVKKQDNESTNMPVKPSLMSNQTTEQQSASIIDDGNVNMNNSSSNTGFTANVVTGEKIEDKNEISVVSLESSMNSNKNYETNTKAVERDLEKVDVTQYSDDALIKHKEIHTKPVLHLKSGQLRDSEVTSHTPVSPNPQTMSGVSSKPTLSVQGTITTKPEDGKGNISQRDQHSNSILRVSVSELGRVLNQNNDDYTSSRAISESCHDSNTVQSDYIVTTPGCVGSVKMPSTKFSWYGAHYDSDDSWSVRTGEEDHIQFIEVEQDFYEIFGYNEETTKILMATEVPSVAGHHAGGHEHYFDDSKIQLLAQQLELCYTGNIGDTNTRSKTREGSIRKLVGGLERNAERKPEYLKEKTDKRQLYEHHPDREPEAVGSTVPIETFAVEGKRMLSTPKTNANINASKTVTKKVGLYRKRETLKEKSSLQVAREVEVHTSDGALSNTVELGGVLREKPLRKTGSFSDRDVYEMTSLTLHDKRRRNMSENDLSVIEDIQPVSGRLGEGNMSGYFRQSSRSTISIDDETDPKGHSFHGTTKNSEMHDFTFRRSKNQNTLSISQYPAEKSNSSFKKSNDKERFISIHKETIALPSKYSSSKSRYKATRVRDKLNSVTEIPGPIPQLSPLRQHRHGQAQKTTSLEPIHQKSAVGRES